MNLPPFVYAKAFWEAVSLAVAGLLALLAFFGYVDSDWAVPVAVISGWIYSFLRMFGIEPELMAKETEAKLRRAERLLQEAQVVRNDLMGVKASKEAAKPAASRRK